MLAELFLRILNMSITAGIVVLFVLCIRWAVRRLPRLLSYFLWLIVLFRLVCPVSFTSAYSVLAVFGFLAGGQGRMEYISEEGFYPLSTQPGTDQKGTEAAVFTEKEVANDAEGQEDGQRGLSAGKLIQVGSIFWAAGVLAMAGIGILELLRLKRQLRGAVWEEENIYCSDKVALPCVYGILRPRIILPANLLEGERAYILLHEQVHIQRGDYAVKQISFLLLCVHWFNPLIWAAFFLSAQDMEMSCDEAVIRKMGDEIKKEYSRSLLALASGKGGAGRAALLFGGGSIKERIKNVLRYHRPKQIIIVTAAVLCVLAGIFALANPGRTKTETVRSETEPESVKTEDTDMGSTGLETTEPDKKAEENKEEKYLYEIIVRGISRSARCIDRYILTEEQEKELDGTKELAFSEDCVFKTNYAMDTVVYEKISFDTFAKIIEACDEYQNKPCILTIENGLVTEAVLESAYVEYGIRFWQVPEETGYEFSEASYTLTEEELWDVAEGEKERVEVYLSSDEDSLASGAVVVRNEEGRILRTECADVSRAGWKSIYLGETDGTGFLMMVYEEDRDTHGAYGYTVYRLSAEGEIQQIAGSLFEFGGVYSYNEELYRQWLEKKNYYLEKSHLVLSTQEGMIKTK